MSQCERRRLRQVRPLLFGAAIEPRECARCEAFHSILSNAGADLVASKVSGRVGVAGDRGVTTNALSKRNDIQRRCIVKKLLAAVLAVSTLLGMGTAFAQGSAGAKPQEYATGWRAKQLSTHTPDALASNAARSDTDRTVALRTGDHAKSASASSMFRN